MRVLTLSLICGKIQMSIALFKKEMHMEVLKLENLSKYYASQSSVVMGLSGINLSFSTGEFVAVTGESGSGKSTLAHVLGGMLPYEAGELYVCGKPTSHYDASDWERYRGDMIGFISQNYGILAGNTVLENVEIALRLSGVEKRAAKARALALLEEVELREMCSRRASKLSSGQKQRLAIARALAKPSRILIADEPTGNLDRENSDKVISLLQKVSRDRLVILITHEFDEVRDVATRHIVLSDAVVVTDARLTPTRPCPDTHSLLREVPPKAKKPRLTPYIAAMTLKARPTFCGIVCLLLACTSFISFALLGTFTVALDDTPTKIYTPDAFYNGDPDRIVVMKPGGERFTEQDLADLLSVKYTTSVERWGYVHDCSYYYRPDTDYRSYTEIINGPNYHPLLNPDDYQVTEAVKFIENELYVRTVPVIRDGLTYEGDLPTKAYEVLSADPNYKIGDTVKVYIRNRAEWSISSYISAVFTVVGTTNEGEGLYFSDQLAAALSHASKKAVYGSSVFLNRQQLVLLLPYDPESYDITSYYEEASQETSQNTSQDAEDQTQTGTPIIDGFSSSIVIGPGYDEGPEGTMKIPVDGKIELGENEICLPEHLAGVVRIKPGGLGSLQNMNTSEHVHLEGFFNATYARLVLVSPELFERMTDTTPDNQISLYIKDYAYADRVMDALDDMGYLSISPFRLGVTMTDETLAGERSTTLAVCLGALLLIFALQIILLKAMFSSLNEHFRLLSHIGLRSPHAYRSLSLLLLVFAVIGEAIGAAIVLGLNTLGVERIVSIFKYLEGGSILAIFAVHLLSVAIAFVAVMRALKKTVFTATKQVSDLDFSEMEDA